MRLLFDRGQETLAAIRVVVRRRLLDPFHVFRADGLPVDGLAVAGEAGRAERERMRPATAVCVNIRAYSPSSASPSSRAVVF